MLPASLGTGEAFAQGVAESLRNSGLLDATSKAKSFATPRRLAVYLTSVLPKGSDRPLEQKLMPMIDKYDVVVVEAKDGLGAWR